MFWNTYKIDKPSQNVLQNVLKKKNILIVGGTAGIGKAVAQQTLKHGANVTIVGRREPDETLSKAKFVQKDLQLMRNAKNLCKEIDLEKFDSIIFSNGIIASSERKETTEKVELDMAVSFLSRYAMAKEFGHFSQRSDKTRKPRIFVIGYPGQKMQATVDDFNSEKNYKTFPAHMNTVVGNEALVSFVHNNHVNAYGLNPGLIQTDIRQGYFEGSFFGGIVEWLIAKIYQTVDQYAENVVLPLLVSEDLETASKSLYGPNGAKLNPNPWLEDQKNKDKVLEESEILLQKALSA
jgi:NAD(P)-dependent dehydrogenase (short-subunit alcohol dehydrogenase family)